MSARHRPYPTVSVLLAGVLAAGCIEIKDRDARSAQADSAAGVVAGVPATPSSPPPTTAAVGLDSVTRIRGGPLSTPEALAALQSDTMNALTDIDTSAFTLSVTPSAPPSPAPNALPNALPKAPAVARPNASPGTSPTPPTNVSADAAVRGLLVPVAGVRVADLRDTYTEQRGGGTRTHEALDIAAPRGTPVLSATGGRVLKLFDSKAGGRMVYAADSTERYILMYAHLDAYAPGLAEGQPLRRGQPIGTVGTSGNAPPNLPHLHFAVARAGDVKQWWKGVPVNPYSLLAP